MPAPPYPDWVAVQQTAKGEINWIIETKGRIFDLEQVNAKDASIKDWCHRMSAATGSKWDYLRINQSSFERGQVRRFCGSRGHRPRGAARWALRTHGAMVR